MHIQNILGAAILAALAGTAFAQAPAAAPPPSWKQGMAPEQEKSALHPFAGHVRNCQKITFTTSYEVCEVFF